MSHTGPISRVVTLILLFLALGTGAAQAAAKPEDLLKGRLIISDQSIPRSWSSAAAYAAKLRGLHKQSVRYDKKTGKVTLYYAAFFAQPVNDVQVNFVIYDITNGTGPGRLRKGSWEAFLDQKGARAIFNSVELDKEDFEMNKKYMFAIESARRVIASGEIILRGDAPKYDGKVTFSDDEAKQK